jgi:hypothetical protein
LSALSGLSMIEFPPPPPEPRPGGSKGVKGAHGLLILASFVHVAYIACLLVFPPRSLVWRAAAQALLLSWRLVILAVRLAGSRPRLSGRRGNAKTNANRTRVR